MLNFLGGLINCLCCVCILVVVVLWGGFVFSFVWGVGGSWDFGGDMDVFIWEFVGGGWFCFCRLFGMVRLFLFILKGVFWSGFMVECNCLWLCL